MGLFCASQRQSWSTGRTLSGYRLMTVTQLIIVLIGGFLAGIINTLAGNGSAITLSILTEVLGLPGNLANGTNRVGILFQSMVGIAKFKQKGMLHLEKSKWIILTILLGAAIGGIVAINVSNEQFKFVFKLLMLLMLVVVLVKPSRWIHPHQDENQVSPYILYPILLVLGFYGGFIQMGMGVFFLAVMVLLAKYDIMSANSIKLVVVGLFTAVVIPIFHFKGLIDWKIGGLMAIGQSGGAYMAVQMASKWKNANLYAYRLLVLIIILVLLRIFGILGF